MESVSKDSHRILLLVSVFIVAICGLIYELVAGAVSSYLLGNSVTQYSLVIGFFLASMGLGSFLTQFIKKHLLRYFFYTQLIVGLLGGLSALLLFMAFRFGLNMELAIIGLTVGLGTLVGMEIPLLVRLIKGDNALKITVPQVLAIDYSGALVASILFPFLLLPFLGLIRSAVVFGLLNVGVAAIGTRVFWQKLGRPVDLLAAIVVSAFVLIGAMSSSNIATTWFEDGVYQDEVILAENSRYQRIVLTRWKDDLRLFLNGHLQFSTRDEHRYHESLVYPVMSHAVSHPEAKRRPLNVLVLGGGDGIAASKVLEFPNVGSITLVDLDPRIVELFSTRPILTAINKEVFKDPRLSVVFDDAFSYLTRTDIPAFDVMIMDLPDPGTTATNKLFTRRFYRNAMQHLTRIGGITVQATSPFYARNAFWCVRNTMAAVAETSNGFVHPYHVHVPSFGDWGFVMMTHELRDTSLLKLHHSGKFMTPETLQAAFVFAPDIGPVETELNELDKPVLLSYHEKGWREWHD